MCDGITGALGDISGNDLLSELEEGVRWREGVDLDANVISSTGGSEF